MLNLTSILSLEQPSKPANELKIQLKQLTNIQIEQFIQECALLYHSVFKNGDSFCCEAVCGLPISQSTLDTQQAQHSNKSLTVSNKTYCMLVIIIVSNFTIITKTT